MTKKLVQINSVCNGSTGRIMIQIQDKAESMGWQTYNFYGRGEPSNNRCYKITNKFEILWSVFLTRLLGKHGYGCRRATKKLIKKLEEINPDVIQLHNIHGYYINVKILFKYLNKCNKKIVWTLHDCWAFTGHCPYFTFQKCNKWKTQCNHCPQRKLYPKSIFIDSSKKEYENKKRLFTNIKNLTIVVPSKWLADLTKQSFLKDNHIKIIQNGIDLDVFYPKESINLREKYNIERDKKIILGVASIWDKRKGFDDFIELSKFITDEYAIVLIGLNKKQIKILPKNIIGIERTENIEELTNWYTIAEILFNPSKEETFSLVTIEAMACGTPVVAYDNSAIKELITRENKGMLLNINDNSKVNIDKVMNYLSRSSKIDIKLMRRYSINNMTEKYIETYEEE